MRPQRPKCWVRRDGGAIIDIFCSKACADDARAHDCAGTYSRAAFPWSARGITGFAVYLICCSSCGNNVADVIANADAARDPHDEPPRPPAPAN